MTKIKNVQLKAGQNLNASALNSSYTLALQYLRRNATVTFGTDVYEEQNKWYIYSVLTLLVDVTLILTNHVTDLAAFNVQLRYLYLLT